LAVSCDIVGITRQRLNEYLKKDPSKNFNDFNSRDLLDFCDIMDYYKIIISNWDIFGNIFRSKLETEKRFLNLKEFRNSVKHGRDEIVPFIQKEGEAALEWLSIILDEAEKLKANKSSKPRETVEQTIARVNSDFVKSAVTQIPEWIKKNYPDNFLYIKRGNAGSHASIKRDKDLVLFYYFANEWVYGELQATSEKELNLLQKQLTKPESIVNREGKYRQVRFHLINQKDLDLVMEIINNRFK
jgi:hypothetical protein